PCSSPQTLPPPPPQKTQKNKKPRHCKNRQQQQPPPPLRKNQLSNAKQASVNQNATHHPIERVARDIPHFRQLRHELRNPMPAINGRMNPFIKADQRRI